MTTTENSGAREEYFAQISNLFKKWIRTESEPLARKCEEKILSITYDPNVALQKQNTMIESLWKACEADIQKRQEREIALQKRVEELENGVRWIQASFSKEGSLTGHLYEKCEQLLTPKQ